MTWEHSLLPSWAQEKLKAAAATATAETLDRRTAVDNATRAVKACLSQLFRDPPKETDHENRA